MEEYTVDAQDVSVKYMVGDFRDLGVKEYLLQKLTGRYQAKELWALRNVTFQLSQGDFLGIIGSNGAGKSTLLKAVSGVITPHRGSIQTCGSISTLLGLGTGLDPALSVKENVYFYGALLGYTEKFMREKYAEIMEFSELEDFSSYKFRQLSSGMRARLAFSIACMIRPDILLLDEVLAVGDGAFHQKSERKMMEIIQQGSTTLFVSHSVGQVQRLSTKVLWLNKGVPEAFGEPEAVCNEYRKYLKSAQR